MPIKELLKMDDALIEQESQWKKKRKEILSRLYHTIGTPPFPRNTRNLEIIDIEELPFYTKMKISYIVGEDDRITAFLLKPKAIDLPIPVIIAMHQTVGSGKNEVVGLDGNPDFAYGHELALRGYVVLVPDYLTAGERIAEGSNKFNSKDFYQKYPEWSIVGKNVEDSQAAVDVACMLDYIDQEKIGVIGHSLGGHNAIFGMAVDERIKVGVSNCGMSVFTEEEKKLEWTLEKGYIYIPALRKYFLENKIPPFDLHEVASLIVPRPWLNISAYDDVAFGNQEFLAEVGTKLYQVYKLLKKPNAFSYYMHGNNHSFPKHARELAYSWLDRYLKRD
ncbi:MAG: dienelactone hydrolase family protein [Candidatus Heimdallarchaeota archaeon]|nr:dienelactone hydrolase family protein [Candidatus Heimdallarchaeota archaeon]